MRNWRDLSALRRGTPTERAAMAALDACRAIDFPVEIYGEDQPVDRQRALRHMLVGQRLLDVGGATLHDAVRRLKQAEIKTEPAFARILHPAGDPYEALLALESVPDEALSRLLDA